MVGAGVGVTGTGSIVRVGKIGAAALIVGAAGAIGLDEQPIKITIDKINNRKKKLGLRSVVMIEL